jgi:hypothetical protein
MILGMLLLTVLWKMYAVLGGVVSRLLCQMQIDKNSLTTSKKCDSYPVAGISITPVGRIRLTITATYFEPKKTHEKSGVT